MKKFLYLAFFTPIFLMAQPANDDCTNATGITDLDGTCNSFSNAGATNTNNPYLPNCFGNNETVWFSFTAQGANADITVSGSDRPEIALIGFPPGSGGVGNLCDINDVVQYGCTNPNGNYTGTTLSIDNNSLTPGWTYIVVISSNSLGNFNLCIDNPPPPVNDDCSMPQVITNLDGTCTTGTTVGAGPDDYFGSCWNTTYYSNGGGTVWYSFVADGNTADVSVTGPSGSYPGVAVYSSTNICDPAQTAQYACAGIGAGGGATTTTIESIYPLTAGETYYVQVTMIDGDAGSFDICIDNPVNEAGDNCLTAEPFCTESPSTFDAATDATAIDNADYGCLLAQPNPKWFYLEIAEGGDMTIDMTNSENNDIDFAIWGPFTDVESGCDPGIQSAPISCSFSAAANETGQITGALAGETYIMVITNYENTPTTITVEQTAGNATTNCAILPVELIYFNVENINDYNLIKWTTATERHNDVFVVEHSTDGYSWQAVDYIDGSGNSSTSINYSTTHEGFNNIINYYRLLQVDYDGTTTTHHTISIDNRNDAKLIKQLNSLGQEVDDSYKGVVFEYYSDGSTRKIMQ